MKIFGNYQVQTVGSGTIMNLGGDAEGDLYYTDANGNMARLAAPASAGDWVLHHTGTAPVWLEETDFSILTVTSADGTEYGDTLIGVTPGTGTLLYKVGATVDTPIYNQVVTGYSSITPPADITATTGQYITVVEVDDEGRAFAKGSAVINSNDVKKTIAELAKLTDGTLETIPYATINDEAGVEAAIIVLAEAATSAGFTTTLSGTYASPVWTGKVTVTSDTTATDTTTDAENRTLHMEVTPNSATAELAKITDVGVETVPDVTLNTKAGVEAAMLTLADGLIGEGFTPSVSGSSYDDVTKVWTGKFSVVDDAQALAVATDAANRTLDIIPTTALGSATELAKITDVGIKTVPAPTENTKVAVEAAMLTLAAALDAAGYTPTIESGSTYDTDTKEWVGKIRETNDTIPLDFTIDAANRTFTVLWAE